MFKIGDFSKLSRVSIKTLRFYDEKGLLKPRGVDRFTRYRYYELDQLPALYRILGLKELGFSLEQIGRLLEGDLSPEQLEQAEQARAQFYVGRAVDAHDDRFIPAERLDVPEIRRFRSRNGPEDPRRSPVERP